MKTTTWNFLLFVTSAVVFAVVCFGCVVPEGAPNFCEEKPGDDYRYRCYSDQMTARCTDALGNTKHVDCFMADGAYCVASCN